MSAPVRSFIFGQGQQFQSLDELKKARALAEAMRGPQRAPQNVGEGLTALGEALAYRMETNRLNKAETAGRESAGSALAKALGGQGAFPPAPTSSSGSSVVDALNPKQTANAMEHERDPSIPGLQIKGGIEETAKSLGIDPVDLATAISYETGGTFDPTKAGPTTKWGQHRGLIQFGEPQAKQYGVDWNNPVGSQLGPDGAVARYLRDTGVKPGMGMLDIYSAINAGGVGRYGASDAGAGGAPGTVADKVNSQMAGHRAKALAMFGGGQPAASAAPVQVASLDPTAGMAEATRPMPEEYAKTGLSQEAWARMNAPNGAVPPAQPTVTAALNRQDINPKAAGQPIATDATTQRVLGQMMQPQSMTGGAPMPIQGQPQQVAQAAPPQGQDLSQIPVMAGGTGGAIDPNEGPDLNTLLEAARNPWLNDQERALVNTLLEQKMQESDPLRKLQLQKLQQELNAKPERKTVTINGRLVDAQTGQEIANFPEAPKAPEEPTNVREYKFYVDQEKAGGREPLPFNEWQLQSKRAGATVINNGSNTSEFVKKSDEAAAKRMDEIVTAGQTAPQTMADMQQLIDLGAQIGTGKEAQIKAFIGPYAQALGIDVGNMNEIQAYEAITSRLAPQMRAVGSGSSSDRDVSMFLQSLPNLRNVQGGNEIIANTMKAVAQNKINAAEIASRAQRGEISWQDADKQIRELPNPYELFKGFQKETETSKGGKVPEGMDPADWEFMTPEERRLFQ